MSVDHLLKNLIPRPRSIKFLGGSPFRFALERACVIGAKENVQAALETLREGLAPRLILPLETAHSTCGDIVIEHREEKNLPRESYRIRIEAEGIRITSPTNEGAKNGVGTLLQILRLYGMECANMVEVELPACVLEDWPRYSWRGMHLDVARTFFPPANIKRFLDLMAVHRFNVLHWHLTDDQGWRIESRRYPRLTEVGAWRRESPRRENRNAGDGTACGGFYTREEIAELVQYAAVRGIEIMPEINFPGHSGAAIAAYPELGCSDIANYRPEVLTRWGVHPWVLAPKAATFSFIEGVIEEVAEQFPFSFFHIGGDEAVDEQWRNSAQAQAFIRAHGLGNEEGLFRHFVHFSAKVLRGLGKRCVGWDEIAEHDAPADAVVTVWRNWEAAENALGSGRQIIMAPKTHTYFDYYQAEAAGEPEAIGGNLPLEKVAAFDPMPPGIRPDQSHLILGAQGQMWSEYLRDWSQVEYMALPRMCALAEILWHGRIADQADFGRRLASHLTTLGKEGYRFRPIDSGSVTTWT